MSAFPSNSPFKLLQPYEKGDVRIFFGRENETRQLAEMLMRSKFMLLYGASGTGKTSLIQCGLQGMFSPRDWLPIFVRRDVNFIDSLREHILEQYRLRFTQRYPDRQPDIPANLSLREAVKRLFNISYVPVYLILDQFEEIFTLGDSTEQKDFFDALNELRLFDDDLFCKILIVTREEYIAHFYEYEKELPFLFEHRFRVEKMRQEQLLQVVEGTLFHPYPGYPRFEVQAGATEQMLRNLTDERGEVDLTTLQVYLDRLYLEDVERLGHSTSRPSDDFRSSDAARDHILFDNALVGENKLSNVLSEFLDRQMSRLAEHLPGASGHKALPLQILFKLVTSQGTKQNRSAAEIQQELDAGRVSADPAVVLQCLHEFAGEDSRILTRLRYAKSGEERFEIVHDRLAEQVFSKFNADEIRQREARTTIENKKKRFDEAAGALKKQQQEYLSAGELELVGQSLNIQRLEPGQRRFFTDSRDYHARRRQRDRMIAIGSAAAAAVFLGVAVVAVLFYGQAQRAEQHAITEQEQAERARDTAQANLQRFYRARYNEIVKKADNYVALSSPGYALMEYKYAEQYRNDTLKEQTDDMQRVADRIKALNK